MGIIVVDRIRFRRAARDRERVFRVLGDALVDAGAAVRTFLEEGLEERRRLDHRGGNGIGTSRQIGSLVLDHGLDAGLGAGDVGPGHGLGVLHRRAGRAGIVEKLLGQTQVRVPQTII